MSAFFYTMFGAIRKLVNNAKDLEPNQVLRITMQDNETDFADVVVNLNTEGQLREGINSLSIPLSEIGGNYAPITVRIKGLSSNDVVTLRDTGDFYRSFDVTIEKDGFIITSDSLKEGIDLTERWGEDIVGLTDMSKEALIFFLMPLLKITIQHELMKDVF